MAPLKEPYPGLRLRASEHQLGERPYQRIEPIGALIAFAAPRAHLIFKCRKAAYMRHPPLLIEGRHRLGAGARLPREAVSAR